MDKKLKKLFSDTAILGFGTFGSKLLVFILMPFYTAWLSTSQYSTAELITGTANLIIPLACVGVANGIFRFAADREEDKLFHLLGVADRALRALGQPAGRDLAIRARD